MSAFGRRGGASGPGGQRPSFGVARPMKGGTGPAASPASIEGGEQFPPIEDLPAAAEEVAAGEPAQGDAMSRLADRMAAGIFRVITIETVEAAAPPTAPSRPDLERDLPLALTLGLVLGLLLAVFFDYLAH